MSPWVLKPVHEKKTASGSIARRVSDGAFLISVPIVFVWYVASGQTFDAWHIFVVTFLLIVWTFRLKAVLTKRAEAATRPNE